MSTTARSPQFLPSPSSPSGSDSNRRSIPAPSFKAPYSPISPSLMSVATKSYVSSYGKNQHTDEMAQRPPRSPAESHVQSNPKINTYQEGSLKRPNQDEESLHRDKRQRMDTAQPDAMEVDNTAMRTDHDRRGPINKDSGRAEISMQNQSVKDDFAEPFLLCKSCKPFLLYLRKVSYSHEPFSCV